MLVPLCREVESMVMEILANRRFTSVDQLKLRDIFLSASLSQAEHTLIDRLFYGVRHGLLTTGD